MLCTPQIHAYALSKQKLNSSIDKMGMLVPCVLYFRTEKEQILLKGCATSGMEHLIVKTAQCSFKI